MTETVAENASIALVNEMWSVVRQDGLRAVLDRYDEFLSEDFEWHPVLVGTVEGGRTYVGRDGFAEFVSDFMTAFGDAEFGDPSVEMADPARVLITGPMRVKGTGSGVPLEMPAAFLFQVADGQIVSGRSFFSRRDALEFLADA